MKCGRICAVKALPVLWVVLLATALWLPNAMPAGAAGVAVEAHDLASIRNVVEMQLKAFRQEDGEKAFSLAAPQIRAYFGTAANFMRMVRSGYGPVYRHRYAEFRPLVVELSTVRQPVLLVATDGRVHIALYDMERQPDGSWRIAGVHLGATTARGT